MDGNQKGYFSCGETTGKIVLEKQLPRKKKTLVSLNVRAVDGGDPARHANVTVDLAFINDNYIITLKTKPIFSEFKRNVDPDTGENVCIAALESILGRDIFVTEVGQLAGSELTELSFYMVDDEGNFLTSLRILAILANKANQMGNFEGCRLEPEFEPVEDEDNIAFIEHFKDDKCKFYEGVAGGVPGTPGECIKDKVAERSGKVLCVANGLPEGRVDVRTYDNLGCNVPTLLPNLNGGNRSEGVEQDACLELEPANDGDPITYIKVRCEPITTTAAATTTNNGTTSGTGTTTSGETTSVSESTTVSTSEAPTTTSSTWTSSTSTAEPTSATEMIATKTTRTQTATMTGTTTTTTTVSTTTITSTTLTTTSITTTTTSTTTTTRASCGSGEMLDEDQNACASCPEGTFRKDTEHSLTACSAWAEACLEGSYETGAPTESSNRVCSSASPCAATTYESKAVAKDKVRECTGLTDCVPGTFIAVKATSTADRECAECNLGDFQSDTNGSNCTAWSVCGTNQLVAERGSRTKDLKCGPCPPKTFQDVEAHRHARCKPVTTTTTTATTTTVTTTTITTTTATLTSTSRTATTTTQTTDTITSITTTTATTTTSTTNHTCMLTRFMGPAHFKRELIGWRIGPVYTGMATAEDCGILCNSKRKCLAFAHKLDDQRCQLFPEETITIAFNDTIKNRPGYQYYYVSDTCVTTSTTTLSTTTTVTSTTSTSYTNTTTTVTSTTIDPNIAAAADQKESTARIASYVAAAIIVWIAIIVLVVRHHRQQKALQHAKMLVIAHQGDLMFGTPEPMRKDDNIFSGGEIDPVTGEMTLFKTTTGAVIEDEPPSLHEGDARLPSLWLGARTNPLFSTGLNDLGPDQDDLDEYLDGSLYGGSDGDSLGDLSDFEDADFEAFADSLLDNDALDEELFGYNQDEVGRRRHTEPDGDDDSLSDFENDLNSPDILGIGYLKFGIGNDEEQFAGVPLGTSVGDRESIFSTDSLDAEVVVAHATYDTVSKPLASVGVGVEPHGMTPTPIQRAGIGSTVHFNTASTPALSEISEYVPTRGTDAVIRLFDGAGPGSTAVSSMSAYELSLRVDEARLSDIMGPEALDRFRSRGGEVDLEGALRSMSKQPEQGYVSVLDVINTKIANDRRQAVEASSDAGSVRGPRGSGIFRRASVKQASRGDGDGGANSRTTRLFPLDTDAIQDVWSYNNPGEAANRFIADEIDTWEDEDGIDEHAF